MERYSFATFVVDDLNRDAYERCRTIARSADSAASLVLLGETGVGKTHLLYAIANRLRAVSVSTALVYMAPDRIPAAVRELVDNPAPIDMAEHAVLLVDDLDGFDENPDLLDAIVQVFTQNDHTVVFATAVNPGRLAWLPPATRNAVESAGSMPLERRIGAQEAETAARRERDALETALAERERELEALRERSGEAQLRPSESLSAEIEHLRAENELLKVSSREVEKLRAQLTRMEESPASPSTGSSDVLATRREAQQLLEQAETLLAQIEKSREDFATAQREQEQQLKEIERLEAVFAQTPPEGPAASESGEEVERLRAEVEDLRKRAQRASNDADERLQAALEALEPILGPMPIAPVSDENGAAGIERLRQAVVRLDQERFQRQQRVTELEGENTRLVAQCDETTALIEELRSEIESARRQRDETETTLAETREILVRIEDEWRADQKRSQQIHEDLHARLEVADEQTRRDAARLNEIGQANAVVVEALHRQRERLDEEQREVTRMLELLSGEADDESAPHAAPSPESVARLAEAGALIRACDDQLPSPDEPMEQESEAESPAATAEEETEEAEPLHDPATMPDRSIYRPDFGVGFRVINRPHDDEESEFDTRNQTA